MAQLTPGKSPTPTEGQRRKANFDCSTQRQGPTFSSDIFLAGDFGASQTGKTLYPGSKVSVDVNILVYHAPRCSRRASFALCSECASLRVDRLQIGPNQTTNKNMKQA